MESHRHEQLQAERRPSLASRRNSKTSSSSSSITQDLLPSSTSAPSSSSPLSLPSVLQPTGQHEQKLKNDTSSAMQCTTKSRRSTPLLWAMLLVASALLSSTRGATARTAEPVGTVASHHLRRRSASLSATIASTTAASEQRRLNIFGDDDRRPVSDPSLYPYSAVGLLRWSDSLSCTASLIADKFIVTAAECALDADGNVRKSSFASPKFLPGYGVNKGGVAGTADNAEKALVVKVHKQSDYWKKWTQNTYVILELDTPIGQTYGVLQLPSLADLDQSTGKTEVQIAGYDDRATDLTKATMQYAKCTCYFPSEFNGPQYMLLHDCDTSASGSPGSPLLVRYTSMKTYIIGIHSNAIGNASMTVVDTTKPLEFSQDVANRGVLGPFIQKQLDSLVSNSTAISNSSSKSDDSASMDNGGGETPPSASSSKPTPTPKPSTDGRTGTDNGDLNPAATAKPSNGESSVNSSTDQNKRITPAAAYISITFVCLAWACILFIAVRHIRRGGAEDDEVADDDDAERIEL